jgi:hypothetical protein
MEKMDWIQLAQSRVQSRVLVNTVIKEDQCNSYVAMSGGTKNEDNFGHLLLIFRRLRYSNIHLPNYFIDLLSDFSALSIVDITRAMLK